MVLINACKKVENPNSRIEISSLQNTESDFFWKIDTTPKGKIVKKQYFNISKSKASLNQEIFFDENLDTLKSKSNYFEVKLQDTLELGKNIGQLYLYTNNKSDNIKTKYLKVIIKNEYNNGIIRKDTFISDKNANHTWFGVYANKKGESKIQGIIIEEIIKMNKISGDSLKASIISSKRFFEKQIYIKDTV